MSTLASESTEKEIEEDKSVRESKVERPITISGSGSSNHPTSPSPSPGNAVDDDDDDDVEAEAERPLHSIFSSRKKAFIVFMAAMGSIFSPISSFIYLPSLNALAKVLDVSTGNINLTVTSYQIFQGLAPAFFGDLADTAGRRPVYIICFIVYTASNVGLALQSSFVALFVLRAMQSTGASGTIALGNGVIADIVTSAERGRYIGYVQAGVNLGPALGPIVGGVLSKFLGWRSIFWFLVIFGGVYLVAYALFAPETARNVVGNGSVPPQGINMSVYDHVRHRGVTAQIRREEEDGLARTASQEEERRRAQQAELAKGRGKLRFPNPINSVRIILEKDVALVLLFGSLMVAILFCMMVTIPSTFQDQYGFNDLQIGLCYIPFSVGSATGSIVGGRVLDWNFRRIARQMGVSVDRERGNDLRGFPIEKVRLQVIAFPSAFGLGVVIGFGWILEAQTTLAGPLIALFFAGMFISGSFSMVGALLVDLYPQSPSTAMAAYNLTRCTMSAVATAVVQYMIEGMTAGWCFTFLGLLGLAVLPLLWVVMALGPKWREERFQRLQRKHEEKK